MHKELDALLNRVLTPEYCPDDLLNHRIVDQGREIQNMKMKKTKRIAAAAAILAASTTLSAYAAYHYLNAGEVAEKFGDDILAQEFTKEPEKAGQTVVQTDGGYQVTFLGMLSGEELSASEYRHNGEIVSDRSYFVVAIEREDGVPMDTEETEFFVSPLIGSLNPYLNNAAAWNGGYSEFVENGILYRLVSCGDMVYFADQNCYLCVTDTPFMNNQQYAWEKEAGEISAKQDYQGLNVLFDLNLDPSLADPQKAAEFLERME